MADKPESASGNPVSADLPCVACGYDLTGVEIGKKCPECGASVADTIRAGRSMTRSQAVAVVLRIGALWIAFECLTVIDYLFYVVIALLGNSTTIVWDADTLALFFIEMVPLAVRLGVAFTLWIYASRVAVWLVGTDGKLLESNRLRGRSLLSVGLILVGVFAVIRGFAAAVTLLLDRGFNLQIYETYYYGFMDVESSLVASGLWLVLGLLLCGSQRLRDWLGRDLPPD